MAQNETLTHSATQYVTDCVLKDDLREILNSSNNRCTIVYKQNFN